MNRSNCSKVTGNNTNLLIVLLPRDSSNDRWYYNWAFAPELRLWIKHRFYRTPSNDEIVFKKIIKKNSDPSSHTRSTRKTGVLVTLVANRLCKNTPLDDDEQKTISAVPDGRRRYRSSFSLEAFFFFRVSRCEFFYPLNEYFYFSRCPRLHFIFFNVVIKCANTPFTFYSLFFFSPLALLGRKASLY